MPIYEYECPVCGFIAERLEKIKDSAPPPICGRCLKGMNRIMSHNSFQLKGSGWYATDYKNTNNKKAKQ